ncbi:hypothetical protein [Peribacillus frigoritolerans]|nr:hypothetical protein [Peribacillus frigoritolerans]
MDGAHATTWFEGKVDWRWRHSRVEHQVDIAGSWSLFTRPGYAPFLGIA